MTQEQLNFIDFFINHTFQILLGVQKDVFNNEQNDEFKKIVVKTQNRVISDLENWLLRPKFIIKPLAYNFTEETNPIRQEIKIEVKSRFQNFKEEQNI